MRPLLSLSVLAVLALVAGCRKPKAQAADPAPAPAADAAILDGGEDGGAADEVKEAVLDPALDTTPIHAERRPFAYTQRMQHDRYVYVIRPVPSQTAPRLIANLHGVCNPPEYACGHWAHAASVVGTLVCPQGNARCGEGGPPTWTVGATQMDEDLERAIEGAGEKHGPRDILTGFSLGAYAAATIATRHPGRWPYLILTEADVPLDADKLRAAGVLAVALVGGELGTQIAGQRRTVARLEQKKFPAKLFVMKQAGHHYSADVDDVMAKALSFVLSVR